MKKILIQIIKKYKWTMLLQLFLIGLNIYFATFPPKIIGEIIDLLSNIEANKQLILFASFYLIGFVILLLIIRVPWRWLTGYNSRSVEKELSNKLFEQFTKIKMEHLQNIKNGEVMSYFVQDIKEIRQLFYRILSYASRIIFTLTIVVFTMITGVNGTLTLITMIPITVTIFLLIKVKKYVEQNFRKSQKYFTEVSEYVQESTDAIRTTKAYTGEMNQVKNFIRKNQLLKQSNNAVDVHSTLLSIIVQICFGLCYGIALLYGSKLVLEGTITTGELVAFNGYIGLFYGPVSWVPELISKYKRAQISCQRLENFMNLEREKIFLEESEKFSEIDGNIIVKDLTFHYPRYAEKVLKNISFQVNKGETLGIIGSVGCGKTTLMNLLVKLYQVPNGKIMIDGKDINEIPIQVLRENICYITQDNFLFSDTLKENIRLFKEDFRDADIEESTKNSVIAEEIERMQNGIETVIGERGVDLSGGQKQRVVISRAFLKKSKIIILDDTLCALDNRTEKIVIENIQKLTKDKTCIIISNRITDIKQANKIIVLENGEIVESGTHESLLNEKKEYYRFYQEQAK